MTFTTHKNKAYMRIWKCVYVCFRAMLLKVLPFFFFTHFWHDSIKVKPVLYAKTKERILHVYMIPS